MSCVQKNDDGWHWKIKMKKNANEYSSVMMIVVMMMIRCVQSMVKRSSIIAIDSLIAMLDKTYVGSHCAKVSEIRRHL